MKYSSFLQIYRKRARLTQRELAEKIGKGINQTLISNWETGVSFPAPEQKKKMAEILRVNEKVLFPL